MRSARIDLRLPPRQKARWIESAGELGLDLSELIRRSVEHELGEAEPGTVSESAYPEQDGREAAPTS